MGELLRRGYDAQLAGIRNTKGYDVLIGRPDDKTSQDTGQIRSHRVCENSQFQRQNAWRDNYLRLDQDTKTLTSVDFN